mgnify:CR=1 FL=1
MYLFGFGSLININSAQKSFQRVLKQEDLIPVQIKGFQRVWNALESIKFDEKPVDGVFLKISTKHSFWGSYKNNCSRIRNFKIKRKKLFLYKY